VSHTFGLIGILCPFAKLCDTLFDWRVNRLRDSHSVFRAIQPAFSRLLPAFRYVPQALPQVHPSHTD